MNKILKLVYIVTIIKGTVSVILNDPPFKDGRFTIFNSLSDQKSGKYLRFSKVKSV